MFPAMFTRKPDKQTALKQLKTHATLFGAWMAAVRLTPYLLHFLSGDKVELTLDF